VYPHQRERLTAALAAHRAAALVGTTPANVAYVTGFRPAADARAQEACTLAVVAPGGTALVLPASDTPALAESDAAVDHVVPYGRAVFAYASEPGDIGRRVREWTKRGAPAEPGAALVTALDALGVRNGTVALDDGGLSPASARAIVASLGRRTVHDGTAALLEARQVKGPWEIEALERALGIAEEALNAVVQVLKPGSTEREAAELFESEVRRREATPRAPLIAFGRRTAVPSPPPSTRALRRGDLVRLDVGCVWEGYRVDVSRVAVAGTPDARQEEVFDAVSRGLDAAIAAARPGVAAGDVYAAVIAAVRATGLPAYDVDLVGHGTGLDPRETPALAADSRTALEAGMVLRLAVPYHEHGWGGVELRDTVLVGRTGPRVMNRTNRGLLVLD
jgi:Xaa-Pro aminopeptidase